MTFLRAWGLVIVVTAWLIALLLGSTLLIATLLCAVPATVAGRLYINEMREWRQHGHPRNRRHHG